MSPVREKATTRYRNPVGETPPLSRAGRKLAEAVMAAAKFKPTMDGKRLVRQFEVHGITVTEWVDVDKAESPGGPGG